MFSKKSNELVEKLTDMEKPIRIITDNNKVNTKLLEMSKYLSRGGFIQDAVGHWCKDGDKIFLIDYNVEVNLIYNKETYSFCAQRGKNAVKESLSILRFKLIRPCEPDVCKDFKEI